MPAERVILKEGFDTLDRWWVEGGERVWVEDGKLRVKADPSGESGGRRLNAVRAPVTVFPVCTVWHKQPFGGNVRITFDAHVVSSSRDANNINLFLFYSDPSGRPLYDSRSERASAGYDLYHNLNGYIVTFLNDTEGAPPEGAVPLMGTVPSFRSNSMTGQSHTAGQSLPARLRLRRCPGFQLVSEAFGYECRRGVTYHIEVTRKSGRITYSVDGQILLNWIDPAPLASGHFGFRTYRTDLWWAALCVTQL